MAVRTPWDPVTDDVATENLMDSLPRGWVGHAEVTAPQTIVNSATETDLTGLSLTVTLQANRKYKLSAQGLLSRTVADGVTVGRFKEGSTELNRWAQHSPSALTEFDNASGIHVITNPSAGSHTYKLTLQRFSGTGNVTLNAAAGNPAEFLIEDIGPAS